MTHGLRRRWTKTKSWEEYISDLEKHIGSFAREAVAGRARGTYFRCRALHPTNYWSMAGSKQLFRRRIGAKFSSWPR